MQCFEDIDTKNPTLKALDLILAAWDEGVDTGVEPQQMVAIGFGIGAPKLADDAVGGHVVHGRAPDFLS